MSDHDALLRAICAHPDDDTPRLVFADFLEENGEADRAGFVRAQVELARTPAWEPFAVYCRHRRPEWSDGAPFRRTLPPLPEGWHVTWGEPPFRRGLGWRVNVASLRAWEEAAPRLFDRAPIGELHLNTSATTLDDLRRFAAAAWLARLRVVHLDGASPVEPVRVLCAAPTAAGITDLHFRRASSPGLPFLVEDLMQAPLGRNLRGLHFHVGYESLEYLIDALAAGGESARLERLSFPVMGLNEVLVWRLLTGPAVAHLTELDLRDNRLDRGGVWAVGRFLPPRLHALGLAGVGTVGDGLEALAGNDRAMSLRRLDLSRNTLPRRAVKALSRSARLAGLRSLDLTMCRLGEGDLYHLARAKFWPNLVELDLRDNPVTDRAARHLLAAPVPADLTTLLLDGYRLSVAARADLRRHFSDRVILEG
jgi:uncharacterized protein (TIGR02996 family)